MSIEALTNYRQTDKIATRGDACGFSNGIKKAEIEY